VQATVLGMTIIHSVSDKNGSCGIISVNVCCCAPKMAAVVRAHNFFLAMGGKPILQVTIAYSTI
jgi:hypothetical protein